LPTVSSIINELCTTINTFIKMFEEIPSLFAPLEEFATSCEWDGSII